MKKKPLLHYSFLIIFSFSLNRHNFFIFLCQQFFNLRDIFIVYFLKFGFRILLLVFGHTLFNSLFQCVYGVTACVADAYFCGFSFAFTLFGQLLAAFLCQWRNAQTDNFSVVSGVMPGQSP